MTGAVRPVHRLLGGLIDVVVIAGLGAGAGLVMRGATPSPLFFVVGRLLIAAYLLVRDVTGASPGKHRMKLAVVAADGSPADVVQRVLRNVTVAVAPLSAGIPFAMQLSWLLVLVEVALVLLGRARLGDLLAQTKVVSTAPAAAAPAPSSDVPDSI